MLTGTRKSAFSVLSHSVLGVLVALGAGLGVGVLVLGGCSGGGDRRQVERVNIPPRSVP